MSVSNFVQKLIGISEGEEYVDYDEQYEEIEANQDVDETYNQEFMPSQNLTGSPSSSVPSAKQLKDKVIGMPGLGNGNTEVMVIEPKAFEEMPKVINALRERKSVVLNLDKMDPDEAQRAVDFVSGGTYAMDGHNERVGDSIFLFTPSCVTVSNLAGLISSADDLTSARMRSGNNSDHREVSAWNEPTAMAQ